MGEEMATVAAYRNEFDEWKQGTPQKLNEDLQKGINFLEHRVSDVEQHTWIMLIKYDKMKCQATDKKCRRIERKDISKEVHL